MENIINPIEYGFTSEARSFCPECEFLKSRCLCSTIKKINNHIHIVVLQHPSEQKHPLNTVRIMKKSLMKMSLFIGEDFSNHKEFNDIISNPKNHCALLYPEIEAQVLDEQSRSLNLTHLIVLDGTWRKAKKIFLLSKELQGMKKIRLIPMAQSDYRIRKAPNENALSTLEAAALSLNFLEPELETEPMINSFHSMVDYQIKKMGRELYQANYLDKKKE